MIIIEDFPNYSINKNGVVINNFTNRIIKHHTDKKGYKRIGLRVGNKQKNFYVHRLVAKAFILNPHNKKTVNHKNGIKSDNDVNNLEWMTIKENLKHAYNIGLYKRKIYSSNSLVKKVEEIVKF
jgi:hypothetical protein